MTRRIRVRVRDGLCVFAAVAATLTSAPPAAPACATACFSFIEAIM